MQEAAVRVIQVAMVAPAAAAVEAAAPTTRTITAPDLETEVGTARVMEAATETETEQPASRHNPSNRRIFSS
jgi:hypothetical protein